MIPHHILIDEKAVQTRVKELAQAISLDLQGRHPILLGLLRGSVVFLSDLARELSRLHIEPRIDFLSVSHYGPGKDSTHSVSLRQHTALDLSNQSIILVDDILDTGQSLVSALDYLKSQKPEWLRVCVFLDKPSRRKVSIRVDYVGFEVPDVWIIGYGLDQEEQGRALPYIAAVDQH